MARTILLIGCGKTKAKSPAPASELYTGSLTTARIAWAERSGHDWYILSARHGLVAPDMIVHPYDDTIASKTPVNRMAWAVGVVGQLLDRMADDCTGRSTTIEIHAGADYCDPLAAILMAVGFFVKQPVCRLGIGRQMQFYVREFPQAKGGE